MRRRLIAGNWKMHGSIEQVSTLLSGIKAAEVNFTADVAVCPPSLFVSQAADALTSSSIVLGAQNVSDQPSGAFTGEVSASMLAELSCKYVIIGHSERRALFAESNELIAAKFIAAQQAGLLPILCLGESLAERDAGNALSFVATQLSAVVELVGIEAMASAVVAYEPIWAIGTGLTASPEQAQEMHAHLRGSLAQKNAAVAESVQFLYGGSVNAGNAAELFAKSDIDGALVGGASLKVEEFASICSVAG